MALPEGELLIIIYYSLPHLTIFPLLTILLPLVQDRSSLVIQRVKNLPAMWETRVWSLGWEDSLEKAMAPHSSTLAWRIPWTEEPGGLQSTGSQRVGHDWATSLFTWLLRESSGAGYSHTAVCRLFTVVASTVWSTGPREGRHQYLQYMGSVVATPGSIVQAQ